MARKGKITINKDLCKGCGVCVHFCPVKSLTLKEFKIEVVEPDKCTACMMCELRCPDFAIVVEMEEGR